MVPRRGSEESGQPEVDPDVGVGLLRSQIEKGQDILKRRSLTSDVHGRWTLLTCNYLEKAFGKDSPNVNAVTDVGVYGAFPMGEDESWWENHRVESLTTQITQLEGLVELLETELQLQHTGTVAGPGPVVTGHSVFLVHGHDEAALHQVARFLESLDQEIIILREQPNRGRTIIEKFEEYGDVGFAVILLTSDDRGGPKGSPYEEQVARARQNVFLELGYFLGRLGRSRVCALHAEDVEIPSDYSGVLLVPLDSKGAWRLQLGKELKAAGLSVDMNKAL